MRDTTRYSYLLRADAAISPSKQVLLRCHASSVMMMTKHYGASSAQAVETSTIALNLKMAILRG
jgi:hypothetical protein